MLVRKGQSRGWTPAPVCLPRQDPTVSPPLSTSPPHPRPALPVVLGVLGGIASGKSAVAGRLAGAKGLIISADKLAHEALEGLSGRIVDDFGPGLLDTDGRIDRAALAKRVFSDPSARSRLEGWIHPLVRERILAVLTEAEEQGVPRVVLDVPLLLENDAQHGLVARCHHLVFVNAPRGERDRRAVETRSWEPGEVQRRETTQLPLEEKRARADFVVENSGTLADLDAAVDQILVETGLA